MTEESDWERPYWDNDEAPRNPYDWVDDQIDAADDYYSRAPSDDATGKELFLSAIVNEVDLADLTDYIRKQVNDTWQERADSAAEGADYDVDFEPSEWDLPDPDDDDYERARDEAYESAREAAYESARESARESAGERAYEAVGGLNRLADYIDDLAWLYPGITPDALPAELPSSEEARLKRRTLDGRRWRLASKLGEELGDTSSYVAVSGKRYVIGRADGHAVALCLAGEEEGSEIVTDRVVAQAVHEANGALPVILYGESSMAAPDDELFVFYPITGELQAAALHSTLLLERKAALETEVADMKAQLAARETSVRAELSAIASELQEL